MRETLDQTNPVIASFARRLNRFVAEVTIEGRTEQVHVANTGRMSELLVPGASVVLREAQNKQRKTRYDLWAVDFGGVWVCIDSRAANDVAAELLAPVRWETESKDVAPQGGGLERALSPIVQGMTGLRREVRVGVHRFDFVVLKGDEKAPVEVKSVNLVECGIAKFPDAPTARGSNHVRYLSKWAKDGGEAHILFVVQRSDASRFRPNETTDPEFAAALAQAKESGVGIVAVACDVSPFDIAPIRSLPVELERP